jgi:hypothetical protein
VETDPLEVRVSEEALAMRRISGLIVILVMVTFLIPSGASAIMLGFEPVSQDVPLGTPADVALTISGLGDPGPPSLGAFDVNINFDPTVLAFDSAAFGDQLDLFGFGFNPTFSGVIAPGVLNLFEVSLDPPVLLDVLQAGSFTLATLTFDAIGLGISPLEISSFVLSDAWGFSLDAMTQLGRISASAAVPEPSTLLLLGSGLIGIPWFRKRWKKL